MNDKPEDDETPDTTVEAAAGAIADLLKQPPEEDGQDDEAKAALEETKAGAEKPPVPEAPDPRAIEAARREHMAKVQEAQAMRAHYAQALNQILPQLEGAMRGELGGIRTPAELAQLAQSDPARYNRLMAMSQQHRQAGETRARLQAEERAAQEERYRSWSDGEVQNIGEAIPEMKEPGKGPALAKQLHDFALKSGYTPEQMRMASANDCAMLYRAMQYQNLEEARDLARARAQKAPRVSEPGTRSGAADGDRMDADFARLKKSGSTKDAAAVFNNLFS